MSENTQGQTPSTLENDRFLRALMRQPVDRTPVWIMRQAGRYLPEYRATRARAGDFMTLCSTPELACEVTLQPLQRYPLDASIIFSDILTIPDAMGLGLSFEQGEGPRFARTVRSSSEIEALPIPDPMTDLRYVMDAISVTRKAIGGKVPLIGFSGSPWTLATYMIEGRGGTDFRTAKSLLMNEPHLAHQLLGKLAKAVIAYLNAQVESGAQALMIFDTWGGILSPRLYREFSLRYMSEIVSGLTRHADGRHVPVILFTKGGGAWVEYIAESGCDAVGLDWTTDLGDARQRVGHRVALQGNLDPVTLYAQPETIRAEAARVLSSFGHGTGHVFNLGHGITPQVDPAHLGELIKAVSELSPQYHQL